MTINITERRRLYFLIQYLITGDGDSHLQQLEEISSVRTVDRKVCLMKSMLNLTHYSCR
jgi:hypothetical protein